MKHGAYKYSESLEASLIGALAVSSLASGLHDLFEGDHKAIKYCAKMHHAKTAATALSTYDTQSWWF